jgi:hypothetical protein
MYITNVEPLQHDAIDIPHHIIEMCKAIMNLTCNSFLGADVWSLGSMEAKIGSIKYLNSNIS